jgi:hypothetical protein
MQKQINELMNDPGWIATETAVMKKKHYFLKGSEESLCGKIFNTSKKVKGETLRICEECKKMLLNGSYKQEESVKIRTSFEVAF